MNELKVLHTADLHNSMKAEKQDEVETCCNFIIEQARTEQPDLIVIPGDTLDEYDGPIRLDSRPARYAIHFVKAMAEIAPVVIVRGTKSHDKETPYILQELATRHPVHVAMQIEVVALTAIDFRLIAEVEDWNDGVPIKAVITCVPSPDKAHVIGVMGGESVQATTLVAREALHDALTYLGEVNAQVPAGIPRILAGHGMITGAQFADCSNQGAVGEDFEFSPQDLKMANCDLVAFGHVHKYQSFAGNIFYSGSPGRLSFGETEEKGFLVHRLEGNALAETRFIPTPARHFEFLEYGWEDGADGWELAFAEFFEQKKIEGADIRVRVQIPEEERHQFDRQKVIEDLEGRGARQVKVELSVIPQTRQRAAGISRLETLPEKLQKWGETVDEETPERTLEIASTIEGREVDELLADADRRLGGERKEEVAA